MSEGFAYIDILFFAMVAAFIALRLRSVLGRRTGQERRRSESWSTARANGRRDNVVTLPDRAGQPTETDRAIAAIDDSDVKNGLTQIRLADPAFDLEDFLKGAKAAFEMIVEAYAAANKDALAPLLAPDVLAGFNGAIDDRQAAGHTLETQLIGIQNAEVVDAAMRDSHARVTVKFTSEQVNVVRDADGSIVDGDSSVAEEVIDLWTFERDTQSDDPNWLLVETRTPD